MEDSQKDEIVFLEDQSKVICYTFAREEKEKNNMLFEKYIDFKHDRRVQRNMKNYMMQTPDQKVRLSYDTGRQYASIMFGIYNTKYMKAHGSGDYNEIYDKMILLYVSEMSDLLISAAVGAVCYEDSGINAPQDLKRFLADIDNPENADMLDRDAVKDGVPVAELQKYAETEIDAMWNDAIAIVNYTLENKVRTSAYRGLQERFIRSFMGRNGLAYDAVK